MVTKMAIIAILIIIASSDGYLFEKDINCLYPFQNMSKRTTRIYKTFTIPGKYRL